MDDNPKFKELMAGLGELFDKDITETLANIYWTALKPFSDAECKAAFNQVIATHKYSKFPLPAVFLEILAGTQADKAMEAWLMVNETLSTVGTYPTVVFPDPAIHSTILALGGWIALGECTNQELVWKEKDFCRIYPTKQKLTIHPENLLGLDERSNVGRGFASAGNVHYVQAPGRKQLGG